MAATGEQIHDLPDSSGTEEILVNNGSVFAMVNDGDSALVRYNVQLNLGDQGRVAREFEWNRKPRRLVAWDIETGKKSWQISTRIAPLTLVVGPRRVYYHDGDKIIARDRSTGKSAWTAAGPVKTKINFNFGPKLVLYKDVVLFAGGDRTMRSLDAKSGTLLWTAPHDQSGYQSPEDLLVMQDLVWSAPTTRTRDSGVFTGRNPRPERWPRRFRRMSRPTGSTIAATSPRPPTASCCLLGPDRVCRSAETVVGHSSLGPRRLPVRDHALQRPGLRSPSQLRLLPRGEAVRAHVLAPATATRRTPKPLTDEERLRRGPAYDELQKAQPPKPDPADWPTYRHDRGRSGTSTASVPAQLERAWHTRLSGRLTSVVVSEGLLFVAEIDRHTLHALDAKTGKHLWQYTVGGRIDSPPTISGPRVLFGSADGQVHCLRARDGALGWSFQAAPADRRLMAFEQLESTWPVHGSVLLRDGVVYSVSGRSTYLDGGLRMVRLDARTGYKLSETLMDDKDPKTGKNLQTTLQTLQMPVGLPDILSCSGRPRLHAEPGILAQRRTTRHGPHSGNAAVQGSVQKGKTAHLFAPMGFLDGTYFHRAYWVYGRSYAEATRATSKPASSHLRPIARHRR